MEGHRTTYSYTPLDEGKREIRLLHLHPGPFMDDKNPRPQLDDDNLVDIEAGHAIHCTLSLASLDEKPEYEAKSYVWGDPNGVIPIHLEGHEFLVTENLHCALKHIRLANQDRILWIDALCINQNDNTERNNQVAQMGDVYKGASQVVVFLGAAWENSDTDLEILELVGSNPETHLDLALQPHFTLGGNSLTADDFRDAVSRVFTSPWFMRLWTVQEYSLAQQLIVQCGNKALHQETLRGLTEHFGLHWFRCCRATMELHAGRQFYQGAARLENLVWMHVHKEEVNFLD
ncbi:hypothetical protein NX059_007570 [Plenodomus lindquistii]|nr:hypothetical protein NX059_007570 [Plenodomus lindquistii]